MGADLVGGRGGGVIQIGIAAQRGGQHTMMTGTDRKEAAALLGRGGERHHALPRVQPG